MNILDINYTLFHIGSYPLSFIELFGTIFGLLSVWWAARANIWTWPAGILNEFAFFLLFFQVQLYADMLLQVFFFVITIYGWRNWQGQQENQNLIITGLKPNIRLIYSFALIAGTILLGWEMSQLHLQLPDLFSEPADYPYSDAFTSVASVIATILMANRRWEAWLLWVTVDLVCIVLYSVKGIYVIAVEYFIFLIIAGYGLSNWYQQRSMFKHQSKVV